LLLRQVSILYTLTIVKKRSLLALATTAAVLAASEISSFANTVYLTQNGAYSFSVGGAFNAFTTQNFAQGYAAPAKAGGGFQTFCIETTVDFDPNTLYTYNLSTKDSFGRNLTLGAAYLYSQFALGTLPGYFGTSDQSAQAELLQAAIWGLQYGQTWSGFPDYLTDPYFMMATNAAGGIAAAEAANNGAYHVEVLQIWDSPTQHDDAHARQNQLVFVPDTAWTAALLGAGAASLAVVSARARKPARVRLPARRR